MSPRIAVTVSLAEADAEELAAAVDRLERAGLQVDRVLEALGTVTGSVADAAALAALERVRGVEAVERQRAVGLPPPDGEIQ